MNNPSPWVSRPVTIALAQFGMSPDAGENLERALTYIRSAAALKADIVALPELFRSPYFCVTEKCPVDYSEELPGEVGAALCEAAKQHGVAIIGGSVYERTPSGPKFNTSLVVSNTGELLGTYRKVHIPHDPAFYERNYFTEGDLGFKVFDLGCAKVGVLICYDQWFPEAARATVLKGAEILFYPTAIANVEGIIQPEGNWQHAWQTVQCGHAVANNVVVCAINRVGIEGTSSFWGGSFICDAFGTVVARGTAQEQLIVSQVDLGHSQFVRESWRFFASRRPDQYISVTK